MTEHANNINETYECCECSNDVENEGDRCDECNDRYSTCDRCENECLVDDMVTVSSNNWCQRCDNRYASTCEHCDERISDDDMVGDYCQSCYERHYFTCGHCEEVLHNDRYASDGRCDSCYDDEDENGLHDYGYRPDPVFYHDNGKTSRKPVEGKYYYGIECECECDGRISEAVESINEILGDRVYCKHDGSLDHGIEIVSHPATLDSHRRWASCFDDLPSTLSAWNKKKCGLHIHVSRSPMTQLQVAKIVCLVNDERNREYINKIAGREENRYCKKHDKKLSSCADDSDRYHAVNVSGSDTVEFRLFRGNRSSKGIIRALEFCDAVVHFCSPGSRSIEDSLKYRELVEYVTKNRKQYPVLHAWHCENGFAESETKKQKPE